MQPCIYILTGISFSGKSVLAKIIGAWKHVPIIDPDAVAHERGLGLQGEFLSDEQWTSIHTEAETRARNFLLQGQSIVYDTTAFLKAERDEFRELAHECHAQLLLIYVSITKQEAYNRWK